MRIDIFTTYYFDPGFIIKNDIIKPVLVDNCFAPINGIELFEDSGDNLAHQSRYWGEASVFYWAYKNQQQADYMGVWAYRRYLNFNSTKFEFCNSPDTILQQNGLQYPKILGHLEGFDVILRPIDQLKYGLNLLTHWNSHHPSEAMVMVRQIINEICPAYIGAFDDAMARDRVYFNHHFLARKAIFNRFCQFIMPILFQLGRGLALGANQTYTGKQQRILGFVAERLWNVFLVHNAHLWRVKEVGMSFIQIESPNDSEKPRKYVHG